MAQSASEASAGGDRVVGALRRVSSESTMLKALLRERHWHNYGMFKRAYQKAAKGVDKDLVETYPSRATGKCHLTLHDSQRAIDYSQQALGTLDPSAVRNVAFTKLDLGMAYMQGQDIDEAARLLGDAAELATGNSSARLTERLHQAHAQLQPWQNTHAVRELNDRLTTYGLA